MIPTTQQSQEAAPHPGVQVRDAIAALELSVTSAARRAGISRVRLYDIIRGDAPVTAEIALRIGRLTRTDPAAWMALQARYDLARLARDLAGELAAIPMPAAP